MKKIAIYGGSFNPIGNHHVNIAQKLLFLVDEVWLMPCYKSITGKNMEDDKHRMNMCLTSIEDYGNMNIKLCDYEIRNQLFDESYNILSKFLDYYSLGQYDKKFYFVIGSDNALTIHTWENWDRLLSLIPFIVIPRPGYEIPNDHWCKKYPHIYYDEIELSNNSSTLIRKELNDNKKTDLVNPRVMEYILDNGLYNC